VQFATALLLVLAANTSFADFPRLSSFLARDDFMPRQFAFRGERLAFTTGILALAAFAIVLLIAFSASVTALIPLYTLGVFLAFTLSQSGMVVRWWRRREAGWRRGLLINGVGAVTTAVVALIVVTSKFTAGAWMVVIMIPLIVTLLLSIRAHYRSMARDLALARIPAEARTAVKPTVIVPIARLDEPARQAIAFANSISPETIAVHVTNDAEGADGRRNSSPVAGLVGRRRARRHRVPVSGAHRPADRLPRRAAATRPVAAGARRAVGVRAAPLVGEPAPQPDRAPPEAAAVHEAEHDRGRRPVPPARNDLRPVRRSMIRR
jgi:hypothetical protein